MYANALTDIINLIGLTFAGEVKSLVFSGKAPVDSHCSIKDNTHVFTEGDDIWDVMLNQVDCNSVIRLSWFYKIIVESPRTCP